MNNLDRELGTAGPSCAESEKIVLSHLDGSNADVEFSDLKNGFKLVRKVSEKHHSIDINKTLHFDPEEIKSKLKKTKKHPNKNLWNLPIATFSKDEIMLQLLQFKDETQKSKQLTKVWPNYDKVLCSAFYCYWNQPQVVKLALCNALLVAYIGSNEMKRELLDSKIILAAAVSVSLQREYLAPFKESDDLLEKVFRLFQMHDIHEPFITYDSKMIEPVLTLVPYVCHLLEKTDHDEIRYSIMCILLRMLDTIFRFYDRKNYVIVVGWLSKHGFNSFVFEYIRNYTVSTAADIFFKMLCDLALYLMEDFKFVDMCLTLIPKILTFLNLKEVHFLEEQSVDLYQSTAESIIQILQGTVNYLDINFAKILLKETAFLDSLADALINNRRYFIILDELTMIFSKALEKIIYTIMRACHPSLPYQNMCKSAVKNVCIKFKPLILSRNVANLFFFCGSIMNQFFPDVVHGQKDETLLFMVKALAVMRDAPDEIDHIRSEEMKKFFLSNNDYLKTFLELVDVTAFLDDKDRSVGVKMKSVVVDELPEIVSNFIDLKKCFDHILAEVITRLVVHFIDSVEDFFTPRWQAVRYQIVEYHNLATFIQKFDGRVYVTKLLLMLKLLRMDKTQIMVSAIVRHEAEIRECTEEACSSIIERNSFLKQDNKTATEITCDEGDFEKFFVYLVKDLKSVLKDPDVIDRKKICTSPFDIHWAILVMVDLAKDVKDPVRVKILKDLVFCALDFGANLKSPKINEYINEFIIHLYMK